MSEKAAKRQRRLQKDSDLEVKPQNPFFEKLDNFFNRWGGITVAAFTCGYILLFSLISVLRYNAFDYVDFDLAIFAQVLWNILHGSIYSSILGVPFLANHLNLILFLIAPLYALLRHPLTLLLLQTLSLGLGAVAIYLLAKNVLDKSSACVFSILYLVYPALHFVNRYEFHSAALTTSFLLFMFYFFEKKRFIPFVSFMSLSLLCKENISLAVLFFGLYVLFFRNYSWKWWLLPLFSGAFWFVGALKIMPYFNKDVLGFSFLYSHLGENMPQVINTILQNPLMVLKQYVINGMNMRFLFQLFFPLAFLCLFSPKTLFIALPFLLQQLLSSRMTDHSIYYHYTAKLIPFLFISAIYGMRFLLKWKLLNRHKYSFLSALLLFSVISNITFGFLPRLPALFSTNYAMEDIDHLKQDFIEKIPKGASTVTTFEYLPKLSQRKDIYSFHHVYMGKYTLSTKEYTLPADVQYALIDFNDYLTFSFYQPDYYKNLQKFFAADWGLMDAADNIGLFKKGHKSDIRLFQQLKEEEAAPLNSAQFFIEEDIVIQGYEIESGSLSLIWKCAKETQRDYWVAFKLVDKEGKLLHSFSHPVCYRVYPTYSWNQGDILKENIRLFVPEKAKEKDIQVEMVIFWWEKEGPRRNVPRGVSVKNSVGGIVGRQGWINLGKMEVE